MRLQLLLLAILLTLGSPVLGANEEKSADYWQGQVDRIAQKLADFPLPASWAGVWNFDVSFQDCDTQVELFNTSFTDVLCEGDPFDEELTCTGTFDDTSANMSCSGVINGPVCTETVQETFTATRNGETANYVDIVVSTFTGANCTEEDVCSRAVVTMTRTAPAPNPCNVTPVADVSWGQIKVLFQ